MTDWLDKNLSFLSRNSGRMDSPRGRYKHVRGGEVWWDDNPVGAEPEVVEEQPADWEAIARHIAMRYADAFHQRGTEAHEGFVKRELERARAAIKGAK